jgi:hypothetical protein
MAPGSGEGEQKSSVGTKIAGLELMVCKAAWHVVGVTAVWMVQYFGVYGVSYCLISLMNSSGISNIATS